MPLSWRVTRSPSAVCEAYGWAAVHSLRTTAPFRGTFQRALAPSLPWGPLGCRCACSQRSLLSSGYRRLGRFAASVWSEGLCLPASPCASHGRRPVGAGLPGRFGRLLASSSQPRQPRAGRGKQVAFREKAAAGLLTCFGAPFALDLAACFLRDRLRRERGTAVACSCYMPQASTP